MASQNLVRAEGVVAHLEGKAWVRFPDGSLKALHIGDRVAEGLVIVTADHSQVALRALNGEPIAIGGGREILADATLLTQETPSHQDGAVARPDADLDRVVQALQNGADPFDALDPAAAGLTGGGGADESHSFVRLLRIAEGIDPTLASGVALTSSETSLSPSTSDAATLPTPAPTINADSTHTDQNAPVDTAVSGGVLHNDVTADASAPLIVTTIQATNGAAQVVSGATTVSGQYGVLTIHPDGAYTYTPNAAAKALGAGENAVDTFTYTAANVHGSGSATLSINVAGINDAPSAQADTQGVAQDATLVTDAAHGVLANDRDPDTHDTLQVMGVAAGTDTPTANVGTALAGTYGHLTLNADGSYTYVADKAATLGAGVTAQDTFTYQITDGHGGTSTASLTLTVTGLHAAPTLNADLAETDQNTAIAAPTATGVLTNDVEPNLGDQLTVSSIQAGNGAPLAVGGVTTVAGAYGTLTISADGAYTYTPNAAAKALGVGEAAVDTFTYTATDAHGYSSSTSLSIKVDGLNDAPTAQADVGSVNQGASLSQNVLGNDSDPDAHDVLHVTGVASEGVAPTGSVGAAIEGSYGHLTLNADGAYTYVADKAQGLGAGVTAQDHFTYQISDGHGGTRSTTLTITVNGLQADPSVRADHGSTDQNSVLSTPAAAGVLTNDTDPNLGDHLVVSAIQAGSGAPAAVTAAGTTVVGTYGSLTIHTDGSYTYTPNAAAKALGFGESAQDSFTYTATDAHAASGTAQLTITVSGTNDAPVAQTDGHIVAQGATVNVAAPLGVLSNDADPDTHDILSVTGVMAGIGVPTGNVGTSIAGTYGHLTLNADGAYTYAADLAQGLGAGVAAQDSFTYQIADGHGGTSTATLTLDINGVMAPPTLLADKGSTDQDTALNIDAAGGVLANDTDPNMGDHLVVSAIQAGSGVPTAVTAAGTTVVGTYGSLTIHTDGSYTYTPNAAAKALGVGESAQDSFTYTATDAHAASGTAQLTITVSGTNDAPVAQTDGHIVAQGATVNVAAPLGVLSNDADPDTHDTLSVTGVMAGIGVPTGNVGTSIAGTYGHLTLNADGAYTYVADLAQGLGAGVAAQDSFTYQIADGHGGTSTATLTLDINGVMAPPTLLADKGSTDQDTSLNIDAAGGVLANDTDPNLGDHLVVSAIQAGSGVPTAVTAAGTTVVGSYGSLTIHADGSYTYTPNAAAKALGFGESAQDSFTYTATDAHGGTGTANLVIDVKGSNDAPTAVADMGSVNQNATLSVPVAQGVLINDSDPDVHDVLQVTGVVAGNGVPSGNVGSVLAGAYGHLTLNADGSYTYIADRASSLGAGVTAQDSFTYQISDGHGGTSTASLTLTVTGLMAQPTLAPDAGNTDQNTVLNVPAASGVLFNDTDPNLGDHLSVATIQTGSGAPATVTATGTTVVGTYGSLTIHTDGSYTYTPNAAAKALGFGESAQDSFTYTATDAHGGTGSANLVIDVKGSNDAPTAVADMSSVNQNATLSVPVAQGVLINDSDPDAHDVLQVTGVVAGNGVPAGGVGASVTGTYGHLTLNADGSYTYVADKAASLGAGVTAQDSFTYQISDGHGGTSTASLTLTVTGLMAQPTLAPDAGNTDQNTVLNVPAASGVLFNDTDPNLGDHLSVSAIQAGSGAPATVTATGTTVVGTYGSLTIHTDGSYTYTPNAAAKALGFGESAQDSFTYTATDAHGGTGSANLVIDVKGSNDAPTAVADMSSVNQNATLSVPVAQGVLLNDSDPDAHDVLQVTGVLAGNGVPSGGVGASITGTYGHLTLNADGSYTYVADKASSLGAGVTAQDSFTYQISDGHGGTSTASLTLTVTGLMAQPTLAPDAGNTDQNTVLNVPAASGVLFNDTDPNLGDHLSVATIQPGSGAPAAVTAGGTTVVGSYGSLTIHADGSYTYTPNAAAKALGFGESAQDSFTYTATDAHGGTGSANLVIDVKGSNDAPTAAPDQYNVTQDATFIVDRAHGALLNDTDPDIHDVLQAVSVVSGSFAIPSGNIGTSIAGNYGHLTLNSDGSFSYTADNASALALGVAAQDVFTYQITDGQGGTSSAALTFNVTGTNDAPVAVATSASGYEHPATPIAITLSGTDVDGTVTGFKVTSLPANGTLYLDAAHTTPVTVGTLINGSGSVQLYFQPTGNWSGTTSFNYVAHDNNGADSSSSASATINVVALNDAPTPTVTVAALDRWIFNEGSGTTTTNAYSSQTGTLGTLNSGAGGTAPSWVSGHDASSGTALSFDGKGGYVQLASAATQALTQTATLSVWVNTTQKGSTVGWADPSIIGTEEVGGGHDIQWGAINSAGQIGLGYGNVTGLYSASAINDGTWHQVVITRTLDTTTGKAAVTIYVDGSLSASGTLAQESSMSTGVVPNHFAGLGVTNGWQGATDTTAGDVYYKGALDNTRIYDHALTADQAKAVYLVENGYSRFAVANDGDAIKLQLTATNTTALSMTGLETGMTITDGTAAHTVTSTGNATAIDLTGWNFSTLQVTGVGAGASATLEFDATNTVAGQSHDTTSYLNLVSGTALLAAGSGAVTVNAPNQASLIVGGTGDQTLNGGSGNDRIIAGTGNDVLSGGAGNDVLIAGKGNDTMSGGLGNDVFRWELNSHGTAGTPYTTTVKDFSSVVGNADVLDLRDLLQGESHIGTTPGNLSSYLHITHTGSDTLIEISSTGGFANGYAAAAVDQKIVLQNVDLTAGGTLTTDNQIISDLLSKGKLHSD